MLLSSWAPFPQYPCNWETSRSKIVLARTESLKETVNCRFRRQFKLDHVRMWISYPLRRSVSIQYLQNLFRSCWPPLLEVSSLEAEISSVLFFLAVSGQCVDRSALYLWSWQKQDRFRCLSQTLLPCVPHGLSDSHVHLFWDLYCGSMLVFISVAISFCCLSSCSDTAIPFILFKQKLFVF